MYYISVQDSIEADKWCFLVKYHTWYNAEKALKEIMTVQCLPCRVEWSTFPPEYSKVPNVF